MPNWLIITWFVLSTVWGIGAIGLFTWCILSAWLGRRNHSESIDPLKYEIVHDGSNPVAGCMACCMWPLTLLMAIYEWVRYGHRSS